MQNLIHADIFFFVTTIAVALVSICFVVTLVYLIRILRDVKALSTKAREEGEHILEDVSELRENLKESGKRLAGLLTFVGLAKKHKASAKENKKVQ